MSLESPNPLLPSENYFTENEDNAAEGTDWSFKTGKVGAHAVYLNLDEIVGMWLSWHQDGPQKNQPKHWVVKFKGATQETFSLALGWKIFQALKRYKGQV